MPLPEDLVHEILARLKEDPAALFRCASTCKQWSRLVARARGPADHTPPSSFLSGLFVRKRIGVFCTDRSSMTSLIPTPQWVFHPHRRLLGSFFPETETAAAGGRLGRAVPLAARQGLLLARLPSPDLEIDGSSTVHLVVCNLLAGTCETLPPLERSWRYWKGGWKSWKYGDTGYAILTEADRSSSVQSSSHLHTGYANQEPLAPRGYSPLFKVVVIYADGASCILNTFSSSGSESRWNAPINVDCETRKFGIWGPLKHPNAVVCHGAAHWLVGSGRDDMMHTLGVDAETGHVTLSKIVIPTDRFSHRTCDEPQLTVAADGTLALLYLQRPGLRLNILVRREDHRSGSVDAAYPIGGWLLNRVVDLKPPEQRTTPNQGGDEAAHLTFIGEQAGTLLVRDNNMRMYAADVETGTMTELTFCGQVNRWNVVPFEIYWPPAIL